MSFMEFKLELSAVTHELRRIADALDRAVPPVKIPVRRARKIDERDVSIVTDQKLWEIEQQDNPLD